jgi:hypothetical protein
MENIKQKIVLPTKGVCNTTPDPICEDNEMEDCVGFTYADDAIRPIQDVTKQLEGMNGTLKLVHRINDGEHANYIIVKSDNRTFFFYGDDEEFVLPADIIDLTSVGNTIIFNTSDGLHYYLWKKGTYKYLGNSIPEPKVDMIMKRSDGFEHQTVPYEFFRGSKLIVNFSDVSKTWDFGDDVFAGSTAEEKKANEKVMADEIFGTYAENKKIAAENNRFVNPFLAVYAVELYDGSYTLISNPILMLPSIHENTLFLKCPDVRIITTEGAIVMLTLNSALYFKQETDYSDWADIVRGVTVFVSDDIELYHTDKLRKYEPSQAHYIVPSYSSEYDLDESCGVDGMCGANGGFEASYLLIGILSSVVGIGFHNDTFHIGTSISNVILRISSTDNLSNYLMGHRDISQIFADISQTSNFYKVAEIGTKPITEMTSLVKYMPSKALANLTTLDRLNIIDYYSHCKLCPEKIYSFNRRLNAIGIDRGFFEGFKLFCPFRSTLEDYQIQRRTQAYKVEVTIDTPEGDVNIEHIFNSDDLFFENMWFFYPDPRAKHVKVSHLYHGDYIQIFEDDLLEHKGLNGAYRIGTSMPVGNEYYLGLETVDEETYTIDSPPEHLNNYLLQSEVDNPFTFNASGYVRVGQGRIIGIAGLTTALSQDAFKVATTIAFTTQGIWALEIDGEGAYKTVPPPFSREVCSNPKSITMVDEGVYFVSKKGLMLISDNSNGCVTTQLCGKDTLGYDSFIDFIQDCQIAYDYRDSQLWLTNPSYDYHWVYNMKSGTLARKIDNHSYSAIVPDYPDTLLQSGTDVFSMYEEPNINRDKNTYSGYFITRPMKFEQAMALKSLRDLKHIKDMSPEAEIVLTIYASNDCASWQQLPSLRGRGFKYFKFKYEFENMKAADAFCGTVLYYTTRLTDRIR